jgi:hypothetical protein
MLPVLGLLILGFFELTGIGIALWGGPILVYGVIPPMIDGQLDLSLLGLQQA